MTYYIRKLKEVKEANFSNQIQLDIAIETKRFIDSSFEKEIHLDMLARLQYTSKFHLSRVFKKYYGVTPRQYLINKRIERAKQVLKSGKSVTETCYAVGFESVSSFSNLFKMKTGMPPSVFRKASFDKSKK